MFSWVVHFSCWLENQHQLSSDRIWLDYGLCQINITARPVYAKKWTGKSLTKAGLSQNFSRQDLAWIGLYLNAYRSRVGLDRLKWPFSHTSLGRVLDKNQPGSQLEFLNHLLIVNCQYFFFLCPMCVLCSVMCDVWMKHYCRAKKENPLLFLCSGSDETYFEA